MTSNDRRGDPSLCSFPPINILFILEYFENVFFSFLGWKIDISHFELRVSSVRVRAVEAMTSRAITNMCEWGDGIFGDDRSRGARQRQTNLHARSKSFMFFPLFLQSTFLCTNASIHVY